MTQEWLPGVGDKVSDTRAANKGYLTLKLACGRRGAHDGVPECSEDGARELSCSGDTVETCPL